MTADQCCHDPFNRKNTLIVESHPWAGVRIRCKQCGACASVGKRGKVKPEICECHSGKNEPPSFSPNFDERNGIR